MPTHFTANDQALADNAPSFSFFLYYASNAYLSWNYAAGGASIMLAQAHFN